MTSSNSYFTDLIASGWVHFQSLLDSVLFIAMVLICLLGLVVGIRYKSLMTVVIAPCMFAGIYAGLWVLSN